MQVYAPLGLFWLVGFFKSNHAGKCSSSGRAENWEHVTGSENYYKEQAVLGLWANGVSGGKCSQLGYRSYLREALP